MRGVGARRYSGAMREPEHVPDEAVVVEALVTVMVAEVGSFALMCTPCDVQALAVGFAFSEGMIECAADVLQFTWEPQQRIAALHIDNPPAAVAGRNLIVTSSCGLCGSRNVEKLLEGSLACEETVQVSPTLLCEVAAEMASRQKLFQQTGGAHAAAVFSGAGEIIAFAEDIGRHNALDKAIGKCILEGVGLKSRGVLLSGRVSLEMMTKAARAGIELVAAVSAPSSLAVEVAERCRVTLCGFVRGDRATVYTHPQRVRAS